MKKVTLILTTMLGLSVAAFAEDNKSNSLKEKIEVDRCLRSSSITFNCPGTSQVITIATVGLFVNCNTGEVIPDTFTISYTGNVCSGGAGGVLEMEP